jgi:hypothetical protein
MGVARRPNIVTLVLNVSPGSTSSHIIGTIKPLSNVVLSVFCIENLDRGISALGTIAKSCALADLLENIVTPKNKKAPPKGCKGQTEV